MLKYIKIYTTVLFTAAICAGQISVTFKNSSQIAISYTAPSEASCAVEVSEESDFSPVVNDVNPRLYATADSDQQRYPTLQDGTHRQFIIGSRKYEKALDGRVYSRGLQSGVTYYIRACGSLTAEVATTGLPFGTTYVDPPQLSESSDGTLLNPTVFDLPRGTKLIDPATGTAFFPVSRAGDLDAGDTNLDVPFSSVESAHNWTSASSILSSDSARATYDGAACGETCDWLAIQQGPTWYVTNNVDTIALKLRGRGSDPDPRHRTVEWALQLPPCASPSPDGGVRSIVLPANTGWVTDTPQRGDTLRSPSAPRQITTADVRRAGGICVLIRKQTAAGTIELDHALSDQYESLGLDVGSGGNPRISSDVPDSEGFFMTIAQAAGAPGVLYKIKALASTVQVRYLGYLPRIAGGTCLQVAFSPMDPNRMYCGPSSTGSIYQLDYRGDSTNKQGPHVAELGTTLLIADLNSAVDAFVATHASHYPIDFEPAKFGCGFNHIIQDDLMQIVCRRGIQDTYAWLAVYKVGHGIIAAYPEWTHKTSRWCGHHSHEEIGQYHGLFLWTSHFLVGGSVGAGQYSTRLEGGIGSSDLTLTLAGQPMSPVADNFLMNLAAGDTLLLGGEVLTVTNVDAFPVIGVRRGVLGSRATAHNNGDTVAPICAGDPNGGVYQYAASMNLWDPIADPYGDGAGISNKSYIGHETIRPGKGVNNNMFTSANLAVGADLVYSNGMNTQPPFAGRIPPAAGICYQTHPTWHATEGSADRNKTFADTRPLIGGNCMSAFRNIEACDPARLLPQAGGCAVQRVEGETNTYRFTTAGSDRPQPSLAFRQMPIYAASGLSTLRNISAPHSRISDATPFTFCIALIAGECREGSTSGEVYLSVPGINYFACRGGESFNGGRDICIAERAAGTLSATEFDASLSGKGLTSIRDLLLLNSFSTTPRFGSGASVKHTPDGKGILFSRFGDRMDLFVALAPPVLSDSIDRTHFLGAEVTIEKSQVPAGTARARVRFGLDQNFVCSVNRNEVCNAVGASFNESAPFLWDSELTAEAGVSCAEGCTIAIPAIPDRITWFQVVFTDNAGSAAGTSRVSILSRPASSTTAPDGRRR